MKERKLLLGIAMTMFVANLSAQPGTLYTGFDADGKVTTAIGSSEDVAVSIAHQLDGKLVVAGYSSNGTDNDFALARYNVNGSLDTSFSSDGKLVTDIDSANDNATSVAVQLNGKIVVAGYTYNGTDYDFAIIRYNSDGSLDNTFNTNGIVTTDFGTGNDEAYSVAIQPDGKIVAAGYAYTLSKNDFALVRYNSNGSLDNTFGTGGKVTTDFSSGDDMAFSMRILPDGRIVAAGRTYNGSDYDFGLACYTQLGTLAISFGTGGKVTTDFGSGDDIANCVFDILDGTIVLAGSSENGTDRDFAVARYNDNGSLDTNFNSVGYLTTAIGSSNDDAHSVFPQPDGKLVVSGSTFNGSDWDFALCRYDTNGDLDNTFGASGIVTTAIGSHNDGVNSSVIIPEGYVILAGYSTNGTDADFALAKYYLWTPTAVIDLSGFGNEVWIYPNPIESEATLKYSLNAAEAISIRLVDMQGKTLETFIDNEKQESGKHKQTISFAEGLPSGNYLIVISSQSGRASIKIVK